MIVLEGDKSNAVIIEIKILDETVKTHKLYGYSVENFYGKAVLCRKIAKFLNETLKVLVQPEILGLKVTQRDEVIFETIVDFEKYLEEEGIVIRNNMIFVKGELYEAFEEEIAEYYSPDDEDEEE